MEHSVRTSPIEQVSTRIQAALAAADWPLLTRLCRQALRKNGRNLTAHRLLGFSLHKQKETDAALKAYRHATALCPSDAELLINQANVLLECARQSEALPILEKVCTLRPLQAICWLKLAQCCYTLGLHDKGFKASQRASGLSENEGDRAAALMQSAIHRRELGEVREAVLDCEAAIALEPFNVGNYTNKQLFMLADPQVNAVQLAAAAREFANVFEAPLKRQWPSFESHQQDPWRRLKIGFISPDFRDHSVMYFVEGLLAQLDRRQFEVHAFFLYPRGDLVTDRVKRHADHFVSLAGLGAQEQAKAIRANGIDILIDLAGHTGYNALLALAYKAAPVQISWLGYPATTGLDAVDYKFTDEITDPHDADQQYTEQLYRLPTLFCCYRPMLRNPLWRYQPQYLVQPTPAIRNEFITFGSCNNLGKLTDEVLSLWGVILNKIPRSRLLIEGKNLDIPEFAATYRQRCATLGIDIARLDLVPLDRANQYLTYHQIDIALDPFPLTGGTTTFDALWMGVPVVSMSGDSFKSRMGVGLLTHLGRSEWLANDPGDYARIAQKLAGDVAELNEIRLHLRYAVENSVLMREDIFNFHFGEGLRAMWLRWQAKARHPDDSFAQEKTLQDWLAHMPTEWEHAPVPGVGLQAGLRVSLQEAHQHLQVAVDKAKQKTRPVPQAGGIRLEDRNWIAVTELAEIVLSAVPHDPVALACLAEVEHAHGHTDFAVTYLRYATQSLGASDDAGQFTT